MADGINAIDYGWKPSGLLQGYLGEQENMYVRARRQQMQEEAAEARKQEQANKDKYNQYLQAQMDRWKNEEKDVGGLKAVQADQLREQSMYPAMKAIADAGKTALEKGDMAGVQQAAERYNMIQNQLPQSVRQALGRAQTFTDKNTGRTVESNYDPQLLADMAENAARSKGIVSLQQQDMKGGQQMDVERERTARALQLQEMKSKLAETTARVKATGNKQSLQQLAAKYLEQAQATQDPELKVLLLDNYSTALQAAQSITPTPVGPTIQDGQIVETPKRQPTPTPMPSSGPKAGTKENPIKLD